MRLLLLLVVTALASAQDQERIPFPLTFPVNAQQEILTNDPEPEPGQDTNSDPELLQLRNDQGQEAEIPLLEVNNEHTEYPMNNPELDQSANSDQELRSHQINVGFSESHSSNHNQQKHMQVAVNEGPVDEVNISDIADLDDTVERLCEKETKKILMIWNVIAKYLGLSSNSYSVTDTASVRRLYAIIQTFIRLSKKEDFNHMSVRNILELILGHLKSSEERGNENIILPIHVNNPNKKPSQYSNINNNRPFVLPNDNNGFKYIVETPESSQREEIDITITGNKHSSSDQSHIVVVAQDNGNNFPSGSPVVVELEISTPETLAPHVHVNTESHQISTPGVDIVYPDVPPVNQDKRHLIEHITTDEKHIYPLPIEVEFKDHRESLNRLQSYYSMSIWQQMLRLYGRCPQSRSLLMQLKFLMEALDRQTC